MDAFVPDLYSSMLSEIADFLQASYLMWQLFLLLLLALLDFKATGPLQIHHKDYQDRQKKEVEDMSTFFLEA